MNNSIMAAGAWKGEKLHRNSRALQCITLLIELLAMLAFLFLGLVERQDAKLIKNVAIRGWDIIAALFTGGAIEVQSKAAVFSLQVPAYLSAFCLGLFALLVIGFVIGCIRPSLKRIPGWGALIALVGMVVFFIATMVSSSFLTEDFSGKTVEFYRLYSFGMGYGSLMLLLVFVFLVGAMVRESTLGLIKKFWFLYLLMAVPFLLIVVFCYYPILLQTVLSFKDYKLMKGIWGSDWIGLQNFVTIFTDKMMGRVIGNTISLSLIRMFCNLVPPLILALMVNEITSRRLKKSVQNITYIPHFFSWVVIYGIVFVFLSPSGIVNGILKSTGSQAINFLTDESIFIPILVISAVWKEIGWGTIIYLAALSGIDHELYDAAAVDGVGPLQRIWHITLPGIKSVVVFLTILAIGGVLTGAGGEQILLFANSAVMNKAMVIDTWMYWQGLSKMQYSLGAAMSFFQAGIGLVLVLCANKLSVRFADRGIW